MMDLLSVLPGALAVAVWVALRKTPREAIAAAGIGLAGVAASFVWFAVEPTRDGWPNFAIGLLFYPALAILSGGLVARLRPGAAWWPTLPAAILPYLLSWGTLTLIEPH